MLGEFFGLPVDTLWEIITSTLVPAGTLDTLSALKVPGCTKASGGLTRSLWAEMVFPDVFSVIKSHLHCHGLSFYTPGAHYYEMYRACEEIMPEIIWEMFHHTGYI